MVTTRLRSALAGLAIVALGLSGCTAAAPLVPDDVVAFIHDEGRMRTYDVGWQNTRMVAVLAEEEAFDDLELLALELSARLHRLENGRAGNMSDRQTARVLADISEVVSSRTPDQNRDVLSEKAQETIRHFDEGDFGAAKRAALEVLVTSRWLNEQQ